MRALRSFSVFGRETLANFRKTGALCASSRWLGRRMASHIPAGHPGPVVELGAGTGSITRGLLDRGIPPAQIYSVEQSPRLAKHLREQFPAIHVLQEDASQLQSLLRDRGCPQVRYIVSSLPFLTLPAEVGRAIREQLSKVLEKSSGRLVQFTYDIAGLRPSPFPSFEQVGSSVVFLNLPPARINVFRLPEPPSLPVAPELSGLTGPGRRC